jgi:hypothetical protein
MLPYREQRWLSEEVVKRCGGAPMRPQMRSNGGIADPAGPDSLVGVYEGRTPCGERFVEFAGGRGGRRHDLYSEPDEVSSAYPVDERSWP